jgi:release factor glutamine methyltransferase
MTWQQAEDGLRQSLSGIHSLEECDAIANGVMEYLTHSPKSARRFNRDTPLSHPQLESLAAITERLLQHEPLQYVLGEAWFMGKPYRVTPAVLIPRPETEELVEWISDFASHLPPDFCGIDAGTGSGCIAVSLKLRFPEARVTGLDVSEAALAVARHNGATLGADVQWRQCDFTDESQWPSLPFPDVLVSNPPYIPVQEKALLDPHVSDWEPGLALFVPNEDPLLFYRLLARFGHSHLRKGGAIFMECHHQYASAVRNLFLKEGYAVVLKSDFSGSERMVKATRT